MLHLGLCGKPPALSGTDALAAAPSPRSSRRLPRHYIYLAAASSRAGGEALPICRLRSGSVFGSSLLYLHGIENTSCSCRLLVGETAPLQAGEGGRRGTGWAQGEPSPLRGFIQWGNSNNSLSAEQNGRVPSFPPSPENNPDTHVCVAKCGSRNSFSGEYQRWKPYKADFPNPSYIPVPCLDCMRVV